jgi:2-polyprenyl-3-methyl-5-hydroxy-6-metoxy-1,4-benzoquinol methylase
MSIGQIITPWPPAELRRVYKQVPKNGTVLDIGCIGYKQVKIAQALGRDDLRQFGVDYCDPEGAVPEGFLFKRTDLNSEKLPFSQDSFDVVIASHIIEHVSKPVDFFGDCVRVCKPGGLLYFEAPSERSLWLPGMPFNHHLFHSLSLYDDPTHSSRPWTPQSFYRLTKYFSCEPIEADYIFSWIHRLLAPITIPITFLLRHRLFMWCVWATVGWASYLVARKPVEISGQPDFRYYVPEASAG